MGRLLVAWFLLALLKNTVALWPRPQSLSTGSTALRLSPSFSIKLDINHPPQDLQQAVSRIHGFITSDNLEILTPDRGASQLSAIKKAKQLQSLTLSLTGKGPAQSISKEAVVDLSDRQESYSLQVPANGQGATLSANSCVVLLLPHKVDELTIFSPHIHSTLGLLRGLTTFSQLWYSLDNILYTPEAPINIRDSPAYPYRGFMLDTARNL